MNTRDKIFITHLFPTILVDGIAIFLVIKFTHYTKNILYLVIPLVLLSIVSIVAVFIILRKRKQMTEKLKQRGQYFSANVTGIEQIQTKNAPALYRIVCETMHPLIGSIYKFYSDNLEKNPEPMISVCSTMRIFYDHADRDYYWMDIDFLINI